MLIFSKTMCPQATFLLNNEPPYRCVNIMLIGFSLVIFQNNSHCFIETVAWRCSVKKMSLKFFAKFTYASVSFLIKLQAKREVLTQAFSGEFCGILKNTLFYRTPAVPASDSVRPLNNF